ncbi:MAG: ATP-grasp domain-containing protein [Candidatus Aminicenantes bacterium]|nr:ATP-grasp domain-containing protein [Candidatus Aminicenantes bacterium]
MSPRKDRNVLVGIAFNAYDPVTGTKVPDPSDESVEKTAREILPAVTELGHTAFIIALRKSFMGFIQRLKNLNANVVVNLCEAFLGLPQLEANVAAAFELFDIPYTGNDSRTLALCLNKWKTKAVLKSAGLPTAPGVLVETAEAKVDLPFPLIVKPNTEDASLGIHPESVVRDEASLRARIQRILDHFEEPVLVESFIEGREFNVAVMDVEQPEALPVSEIDFSDLPEGQPAICGYEAKWHTDGVLYAATKPVCPAKIEDELKTKLQEAAVKAFLACECRDYARVDFRVDKKNRIHVLEVNPNPDISLDAGYVRALKAAGIEYKVFWQKLIDKAMNRRKGK